MLISTDGKAAPDNSTLANPVSSQNRRPYGSHHSLMPGFRTPDLLVTLRGAWNMPYILPTAAW